MSISIAPPHGTAVRSLLQQIASPGSHVDAAVERARRCLFKQQRADGHWCGELQGDTILESEYVLLLAFLGRENDEVIAKLARYILTQERSDGGWANYPHGPVDLSVSVKAYFALKIAGYPAEHPSMRRARAHILELGGAAQCNSFSKFYLAMLSQFPYDNCASVPPEMMFLPRWFYVNLYAMSAWTRTIVVPLSIFSACKPQRSLPANLGIAELFVDDPAKAMWPCAPSKRLFSWTNFFLGVDWLFKKWETLGSKQLRKKAVDSANRWMQDHFEDSDGVGAIFPPMVYTVISLRALGYADDSPEMKYALKQLEDLYIEEGDGLRLQPCVSPVWDTALAVNALAMSGFQGHEGAVADAARWLVEREVTRRGDWSLSNPEVEAGGWFFEYRNGFYPDTDDTAMVLMGLARSGFAWDNTTTPTKSPNDYRPAKEATAIPAVQRGIRWLIGMQNSDGGWAAFDRDINREVLTKVPFADHNAMLDPSCPDITARALEALGQFDYGPGNAKVDRALAYLERTQDPRGCWLGRWGVNYLYGTWQVLVGLEAIGLDRRHPMIRKAVAWLKSVQQDDGPWGESCHSYDDPSTAGQGEATPSQTAWALLGLIAAGEADCPEVKHGIDWLMRNQDADGSWQEDQFTGTGFPKVFYLKYHLYRLYFPLMALARYRKAATAVPHPEKSNGKAKRQHHVKLFEYA